MEFENKAKEYGINCHQSTNHLYDGKPYEHHLKMVHDAALEYIHLIPNSDVQIVLAACWVHDVIEDCRQSYNDVLAATNTQIADLVYALTTEKGKTRNERTGEKYYTELKETPYADFVKVCDRIANIRYSKSVGSRMFKVYQKESREFREKLWNERYSQMFKDLDDLVKSDFG